MIYTQRCISLIHNDVYHYVISQEDDEYIRLSLGLKNIFVSWFEETENVFH